MKTPFTIEEFFGVFEKYNTTIFPLQIVIILLGIAALFIFHSTFKNKSKIIGSFLTVLWLWIGIVYHITFFTEINKVAYAFGGLFIIQGLLFVLNTLTGKLEFSDLSKSKDKIGYFFVLYGLIIYPIISYFIEGSLARTIALGLPCPSTIMTFGLLMLANNKFPKYLLVIPSIWAIIGVSAAINLGVYQDIMIIISAIFALIISFKKNNKI